MIKKCSECKWLTRYESNDHTSYMNVCTAEDVEALDDGMYTVVVIDFTTFDASDCLNYRPK